MYYILFNLVKIKNGKCNKGHELSTLDCYLISDYYVFNNELTKATEYFAENMNKTELNLGKLLK